MNEVDRIKILAPNFYFTVVNYINIIDTTILEIICVAITTDAKDIVKRTEFGNYFENFKFQSKSELLEIILKVNYSDILKKYPNFFANLVEIKKWRNSIAHSPVHYERDSNEKNAKLVLHNRKIKKQKKLSEKQMLEIMKKVEKYTDDTREILRLIGKTKGLRF